MEHPPGCKHSITSRAPSVKASGEHVSVQKVVKLGKIERSAKASSPVPWASSVSACMCNSNGQEWRRTWLSGSRTGMNRMIRWATTNWRSCWFYHQLRPQNRPGNLFPEHYTQQQARELTDS